MSKTPALAVAALLALPAAGLGSCAHGRWSAANAPSGATRRVQAEAAGVPAAIAYEDEFVEARLVYQALPMDAPERGLLRGKLIHYLLAPIARLDAGRLRDELRDGGTDDVPERIFESFREALDLYEPTEVARANPAAAPTSISTATAERDLLIKSARLVADFFSGRGGDIPVATAFGVLMSLDPGGGQWSVRLDQLLTWTEGAAEFALESPGAKRGSTAIDILEHAVSGWPSAALAERLEKHYLDRQRKFVDIVRQPLQGGDTARKAMGSLLLVHGEDMQRSASHLAALYLRCGRLDDAARAAAKVADQAGDDPDLRQLVNAAAARSASAADFMALARRFLPRGGPWGGTAPEVSSFPVAIQVLRAGTDRHPADSDLLILAARVAAATRAPFLAIRLLEEARAVLERGGAPASELRAVSDELLILYFARLQRRIDPDRIEPAAREAEGLRRQLAEERRRFGSGGDLADRTLSAMDIDLELGRGYLQAGLPDAAEPLLARAHAVPTPHPDATEELASLALKRGDPARAIGILSAALGSESDRSTAQGETRGAVTAKAKLYRLLGDAYDAAIDRAASEGAWAASLHRWEQLAVDGLRRKDSSAAAEATFEVGRLYYLLGRRNEGIKRLEAAIDQDEDRGPSYIDVISFLVQNGEVDAAVAAYRRALSRSDRVVSEYVKVYVSLWIADITRRSGSVSDPSAQAFLAGLDARHGELRPARGADWYRKLARHAIGKLRYQDLLREADTAGKRAELHFYQAMRSLADGNPSEANQLWKKVLETRMFKFFEFDMAARYLRAGAPSRPLPLKPNTQAI